MPTATRWTGQRAIRRLGKRSWLVGASLLTAAGLAYGGSESVSVLPDAGFSLGAARYCPAQRDVGWTTSLSAELNVLRWRRYSAYGTLSIETILGDTRRSFDTTQANYHGVLGAFGSAYGLQGGVIFSHVSRHAPDREKLQAVDWNIWGVAVAGELASPWRHPLRLDATVGHATESSLVGYKLELTGRAETVLASAGQTAAALAGELRYVTSNPTRPAFTRRCFLDWKVEARGRFTNGPRRVEIYTAVERRNDIQLLFEQARTRLLLGLRFGLAEASPAPGFPR